jgi:hypothetical protein
MKALIIRSLGSIAICSFASGGIYTQDFTAADGTAGGGLGDGSDIRGVGNIQSNALELSRDGAFYSLGAFVVPALSGSSNGWTATFDFMMSSSLARPADGFSFNYGDIGAGLGVGEGGWDSGVDHVSFEIDTWANFSSDQGTGIGATVGADSYGVNGVDTAPPLASISSDPLPGFSTVSGTATMSWDPTNGASFITTGLATNANFTNIAIPGFSGNDSYGFALTARTGGATQTTTIDNLSIVTSAIPEPSSFGILGLAAAGLMFGHRRR